MTYGDFKDLAKRTASDKVLRDKAFNIAKNSKCDGYQRGLTSMVYIFFDNKSLGKGVKFMSNQHNLDLTMQQLGNELHKPIIRRFQKRRVYFSFRTIFGVQM